VVIIQALRSGFQRRSLAARLLCLALLLFVMTACGSVTASPLQSASPQQSIVGNWANVQGGMITFYANGTGFVPGIKDSIADSRFTYAFPDKTHMQISMAGQTAISVEIKIEGDTMTWRAPNNGTTFVYKRTR
jgi:hypothetical protein